MESNSTNEIKIENSVQSNLNSANLNEITTQPVKHKLKDMFNEMDKKKSTRPKTAKKKLEVNVDSKGKKIIKEKIDIDVDPSRFKTKPTKPDFSSQMEVKILEKGVVGLNLTNSSQYKGLTNFGNICYSNVVLQCLIGLKEFHQMLNFVFKKIEDFDNIDSDYPMLFNLVKIMNYYQVKNTSLASNHIKLIVNMFDFSGEQNDAHEFLVFIFDKLNEEILKLSKIVNLSNTLDEKDMADNTKSKTKSKTLDEESEWEEVKKGGKRMKQVNTVESFQTSIIGKLFQGILKHEIESKGKSLSKCNIEPFFVLSLDFGENSIESCFTKFFSKRRIDTNDSANTIFQRSYIEKLPNLFIVHLKAFYYDKNAKKIVKINKEIEYGENLKIPQEYFSPSMQSLYKGVEFELVSGNYKKFIHLIYKI